MKPFCSFRHLAITVALSASLLLLGAGFALASSCTTDSSSSSTPSQQTKEATQKAADTVTHQISQAFSNAIITSISSAVSNSISSSLAGAVSGTPSGLVRPQSSADSTSGLNAGDEPNRFGVWGMGQAAFLANTGSATRFDGTLGNYMIGADYKPLENLVVGVAGGYENGYLITKYNSGSITDEGFSVIPYASYKIFDTTSVDVLGGWTFVNYRNVRGDISGSQDALRSMVSASLNQYFQLDAWTLSAQLGHLYVNEHKDSFTESDGTQNGASGSYLGEWRIQGKAAYLWNSLQPYLGLSYLYDYTMSSAVGADRDEIEGVLGLNYFYSDKLTFSLEGANSFDRNHAQNSRAMLNIRYSF